MCDTDMATLQIYGSDSDRELILHETWHMWKTGQCRCYTAGQMKTGPPRTYLLVCEQDICALLSSVSASPAGKQDPANYAATGNLLGKTVRRSRFFFFWLVVLIDQKGLFSFGQEHCVLVIR